MKVFINPGHAPDGDPDAGAINSATGTRECDLVLEIGKKLKYYLEALGQEVKLFQDNLPYKIIEEAVKWHSDILISLHCGYSWDQERQGTCVLYYGSQSEKIAEIMQYELQKCISKKYKEIQDVNQYILISSKCPAVMLELGFISNCEDLEMMLSRQDDIVQALARGIVKFF